MPDPPQPTQNPSPEPDEYVGHIPVLLNEVLEFLAPKPGQTILDGTLGRGGHAAAILPFLGESGRYIGLDVDPENLKFARKRLESLHLPHGQPKPRLDLIHANFANATDILRSLNISRIDGLLVDLGFASNQIDDPERGFSFANDGPLDMRLDPTLTETAADLVNRLTEQELADLIFQLGEERASRKIARKICDIRARSPIHKTSELAQIVRAAYGPAAFRSRIHPATRTFMALRIAVNRELDCLDTLLESLPNLLHHTPTPNTTAQSHTPHPTPPPPPPRPQNADPTANAVIISFHSLEDRRVKQAFNRFKQQDLGRKATGKVITADPAEQQQNPRSRSAKLRAFSFQ